MQIVERRAWSVEAGGARRSTFYALRSALYALTLLLVTACASSPAKSEPFIPNWSSIPPVVLDALCARLRTEGVTGLPVTIVRTTQPLVNSSSLRSLAHNYQRDGEVGALAQAIGSALQPMPLDLAAARSCQWDPIDKLDPIKHAQYSVVELSSPLPNPFTRGEAGVFVRMSVGGHDAQWYWIPLGQRNGQLGVGAAMPLDLHES